MPTIFDTSRHLLESTCEWLHGDPRVTSQPVDVGSQGVDASAIVELLVASEVGDPCSGTSSR